VIICIEPDECGLDASVRPLFCGKSTAVLGS
jgi:hypothetical protein